MLSMPLRNSFTAGSVAVQMFMCKIVLVQVDMFTYVCASRIVSDEAMQMFVCTVVRKMLI